LRALQHKQAVTTADEKEASAYKAVVNRAHSIDNAGAAEGNLAMIALFFPGITLRMPARAAP
jgi:hypothetical protein